MNERRFVGQNEKCSSSNTGERGVVLVLVIAFVSVLMLFCAMLVGLGMMTAGRSRLQNAANLAALGSLENFYVNGRVTGTAATRATEIVQANRIPGVVNVLGTLSDDSSSPGASGSITFGEWYKRDPDGIGPSDPCSGSYPCFVKAADPTDPATNARINSVEVALNTQSVNPLVAPFMSLIGPGKYDFTASATATVVERCTGFLIDVSRSVTSESHQPCTKFELTDIGGGDYRYRCHSGTYPVGSAAYIRQGAYAYRLDRIKRSDGTWRNCDENAACLSTKSCVDMDVEENGYWAANRELASWCSMEEVRMVGDRSKKQHYRSDYYEDEIVVDTGGGPETIRVLIDKYVDRGVGAPPRYDQGPQPFTRFFLAFNAAIRDLYERRSSSDKVFLMVFSGNLRGVYPNTGLTGDLGAAVNFTNLDFGGTYGIDALGSGDDVTAQADNFIKRGWVPITDELGESLLDQTNVLLALNSAINTLVNNCPASTKKTLILASDGLTTCEPNGGGYDCGTFDSLAKWAAYEGDLLDRTAATSIRNLLLQNDIALTTMLDGAHINPNIRNLKSNKHGARCDSIASDEPECLLSAIEVSARPDIIEKSTNNDGFFNNAYQAAVPLSRATEELSAWFDANRGRPGSYFGRPNGIFGKLALETGGVVCPLLQYPGGAYVANPDGASEPDILDPATRAPDSTNLYSLLKLTKAQQAVDCARQAVGRNPFVLVSPEPFLTH